MAVPLDRAHGGLLGSGRTAISRHPTRSYSGRSESSYTGRSDFYSSSPKTHGTIRTRLFDKRNETSPRKKTYDEWANKFTRWSQMPSRLRDPLVHESRSEVQSELSKVAYLLKLSHYHDLDDQLPALEAFTEGVENSLAINIEPSLWSDTYQGARAWVDHQVWLGNRDSSWTIPEQPDKILSPSELEYALRPMVYLPSTALQKFLREHR